MRMQTVLWYEFELFKSKFWSITSSSMIAPLLYLIAFGWGLGSGMTIDGSSYMNFVIPGIIALSTMNVSFNTVAKSLNIARTYDKTFEEFMTAPIPMWNYTVGKVLAGAFRGLYSAALIIFFVLFLRTNLQINFYFIFITFLNSLVFSSLGFVVGMIIDSHIDLSRFTNFIITPMSFLCGTFFPVDKMPGIFKQIVLLLPLTQTTEALRGGWQGFGQSFLNPTILIIYFAIILAISIILCKRAE